MPFLVTPPLPSLKVEIAFDSGFATAEGDRTWTDVSAYVEGAEGCSITYGRADELSTPDPNTLSISFDNRDGRFTPAKVSSPYFPNVKKGKPIRVTVTYAGVDYVRFTGYVNEWPLVWPDGSSAASTVTVSASSRRARLGQTAPLTSAIRAAYLATGPQAYWPMTDLLQNLAGQFTFLDVTNYLSISSKDTGSIAAFAMTSALNPIIDDGTPGPTDETSLVKLPSFTDPALIAVFAHYVGGGGVVSANTAGEVTAEVVARIGLTGADNWVVNPLRILTADYSRYIYVTVTDLGGGNIRVGMALAYFDATGAAVEIASVVVDGLPSLTGVLDGEIHHYAVTLTGGDTAELFLDGISLGTCSFTGGRTVDTRLTSIAFGDTTYLANLWVGHGAVTDRALTDAEILAHAQAATAASETDAERVVRVAGRVGVPADEIDAEVSVAAPLGPQTEVGRSAVEVIDELTASTGGIIYDTRAGHLAMQARQTRYNTTALFTLDATTQEVQGDLTVMTDDRYLINTIEFTRAGDEAVPSRVIDQDSIDDYGVYSTSLTIVSSSDQEVEAAAQDQLARFADGGATPRISQVSVDIVNLEATQRDAVLAADIGTKFAIANLPPQAPSDPMNLFFEGATESITATSHTMTMNTTPGDIYTDVWIADSNDLMDSGIVVGY